MQYVFPFYFLEENQHVLLLQVSIEKSILLLFHSLKTMVIVRKGCSNAQNFDLVVFIIRSSAQLGGVTMINKDFVVIFPVLATENFAKFFFNLLNAFPQLEIEKEIV